MLSLKQEQFLNYWDLNRQHLGTTTSKILRGLPMAFIFGLPILLLLAVIYFFLPEWYYKISNVTTGSIITAVIAVFIAILFMSYFRMHFKWEMNEQLYRELLQKKNNLAEEGELKSTALPKTPSI